MVVKGTGRIVIAVIVLLSEGWGLLVVAVAEEWLWFQ